MITTQLNFLERRAQPMGYILGEQNIETQTLIYSMENQNGQLLTQLENNQQFLHQSVIKIDKHEIIRQKQLIKAKKLGLYLIERFILFTVFNLGLILANLSYTDPNNNDYILNQKCLLTIKENHFFNISLKNWLLLDAYFRISICLLLLSNALVSYHGYRQSRKMMNITTHILVFHCAFSLIWAIVGDFAYKKIFYSCNGSLAGFQPFLCLIIQMLFPFYVLFISFNFWGAEEEKILLSEPIFVI